MIEVKNISKIYTMGEHQVHALNDVSLKIQSGDFVAIMGPSGSGKSTLAHILGLLDVPTGGSYQLNGREVAKLSEDELAVLRRGEIGFIFQQFNLLARANALTNVALPLLYSEKNLNSPYPLELLKKVGLGERWFHRPNELSGGQQQRVAIARALVNRPKIIFADEPTGNLDSKSEKEIMTLLKELNGQGITVIMVTHEDEIGRQAKRLIRMRDGEIQSDERLEDIKVFSSDVNGTKSNTEVIAHWWDFLEHFKQGFKTLVANKIRTALSVLGILIGVAAVIAMLALGSGAQKAIEAQLSSLGSNLLVLRPGARRVGGVSQEAGVATRLTPEDAAYLIEKIDSIKSVSPSVDGRVQAAYGNKNWNTRVMGTDPSYAVMRNSKPTYGRFFNLQENQERARVAVIGVTIVKELFEGKNPIGEFLKINKVNFQIVGVLPERGSGGWRDEDDTIIVPLQTAMYRLLGKNYVDSIDIEIKNEKLLESAENQVLELMYVRQRVPVSQREGAFRIMNMASIQDAVSQTSKTMTTLLASIAAISLLVGGIGIMNIMLVSVTERTKEVGLRKAIGAKRADILIQFLAESVVVSVVGGLAGIFLGWLITIALSIFSGWTTSISIQSVMLSFFFSAFVGIVFGIYPARKASLLHPIDALRFE